MEKHTAFLMKNNKNQKKEEEKRRKKKNGNKANLFWSYRKTDGSKTRQELAETLEFKSQIWYC